MFGTKVGIAREQDRLAHRALSDRCHQLIDLCFPSSLVGAARTRIEMYVVHVDVDARSQPLPGRKKALGGQTIEVAIDHAVALSPSLALQASERLNRELAQAITEMQAPVAHESRRLKWQT